MPQGDPAEDPLKEAAEEIRYLKRAIDGDDREGFSGLRARVKKVEDDLEIARQERERLNWRLSMLSGVLKWLGPSGVMLIIGFIAYVLRQTP